MNIPKEKLREGRLKAFQKMKKEKIDTKKKHNQNYAFYFIRKVIFNYFEEKIKMLFVFQDYFFHKLLNLISD